MPKVYAHCHQPSKAVYFTGQILLTCFVRLPYWLVVSLPRCVHHFQDRFFLERCSDHDGRSWRPRSSWTFKQCILVKAVQCFSRISDQYVYMPSFVSDTMLSGSSLESESWSPCPITRHSYREKVSTGFG